MRFLLPLAVVLPCGLWVLGPCGSNGSSSSGRLRCWPRGPGGALAVEVSQRPPRPTHSVLAIPFPPLLLWS